MLLQNLCEGWIRREVFNLMRILLDIIEFLSRAGAEKDLVRQGWKSSGCMTLAEKYDVVTVVTILRLKEWAVGKEIADVAISVAADAAYVVDRVITTITGGDHIFTGGERRREEVYAIVVRGYLDACKGERSRGDVEGRCQFVADAPCADAFVSSRDNQWHVGARFGAELLGSQGMVISVVGEPEDDGVFQEAIRFEIGEDLSGVVIGLAHGVIVVGVPLTKEGGVWQVRRRSDGVRVDLVVPLFGIAFTPCELDLTKPRFAFWEIAPGTKVSSGALDGIEVRVFKDEVVVLLPAIEGEVAMLSEELGDCCDAGRKVDSSRLGSGGTVVVQPSGCLIGAGNHCGPARGAYWGRDVAPRKSHPALSEGVYIGCLVCVNRIAVATDKRGHVLDKDPEDIGPTGGGGQG